MTTEVKPFVPFTDGLTCTEEPPVRLRLVEESDKLKSGDDCCPPPALCPVPPHPTRLTRIMDRTTVTKLWIVFFPRFMYSFSGTNQGVERRSEYLGPKNIIRMREQQW